MVQCVLTYQVLLSFFLYFSEGGVCLLLFFVVVVVGFGFGFCSFVFCFVC